MVGGVRTGVVGLGYFGSFHARHYAANPQAILVGVADADGTRAEAAASKHGVTPYTDHRDLIGRIDAVSIAAPTSLHHAIACDFIDAGVHILVEKPVTDDPVTARDLVRRAEKKGVVFQVGHIERFSPTFRALAGRIAHPDLAMMTRIGPWSGRADDVDVVVDLMIHDIDLALSLIGLPVVSVEAVGMELVTRKTDFAVAYLKFADGAVAALTAGRGNFPRERSIRLGEKGNFLNADLIAGRIRGTGRAGDEIVVAPRDALGDEIAAFLETILTGRPAGVDGRAGFEALLVAEMIRLSIRRKGAPVEGARQEEFA